MPKIKYIKFDSEKHRYTDEDQNVYISVTQKEGLVIPVFDEQYWAAKKAKERGISKEEVLLEWANIRNYANAKGNIVHKKNEDSINQSAIGFREYVERKGACGQAGKNPIWGYEIDLDIFAKSPLAIKYPKIYLTIKNFVDKGWNIFAEKRVYLYEYLIAGTIDLLLVKGDQFIIIDWKTNKDALKFTSGYYKKENGIKTNIWVDKKEYLKFPLDMIEHCKGSIYTLQLSLYARMVEEWGYKCTGLLLFHIRELTIEGAESETLSDAEVVSYKIPYWKDAAWRLITHQPSGHKEEILKQPVGISKFGIK